MSNVACKNTDIEIWRRVAGDIYSPSIHVTSEGAIMIDTGGHCIVMPLEDWHKAGEQYEPKECE